MLTILLTAAVAATPVQADVAAATQWVSLIDSSEWPASWAAAGTLFKAQMPEAKWASTVEPVREPLGPVSSRRVKSVTATKTLPGAPDGHYEIIQYQTSFANKADATETVILSHEPAGWKVDGYFIR